MLKKIWLFSLSLGFIGCIFSIYFSLFDHKETFILITVLSISLIFLGISFRAIRSERAKHKKLRWFFLIIALSLLGIGLMAKYLSRPGANLSVTFSVLSYCFKYAPLELYIKNEKWSLYSKNKWEMLLLSTLDFVGLNLVLLGILSRIMHWPGQYYLIYPGIVILITGLIAWNIRFKQEVIRRKNSEDKIKT